MWELYSHSILLYMSYESFKTTWLRPGSFYLFLCEIRNRIDRKNFRAKINKVVIFSVGKDLEL